MGTAAPSSPQSTAAHISRRPRLGPLMRPLYAAEGSPVSPGYPDGPAPMAPCFRRAGLGDVTTLAKSDTKCNTPHCLTKKVLESDSLPQIRKYSKAAELLALHMGGKEGGDGGPIDAREASDHQGDGAAVRARRQAGARADARRALRPRRLQQKLRGPAAARQGPR